MRIRQLKKAFKKPEAIKMVSQIGFTGCGPTGLDKEVDIPIKGAKLTKREKHFLEYLVEKESMFRQNCFRDACMEVMGEDPDDWCCDCEDMSVDEYDARRNNKEKEQQKKLRKLALKCK